MDKNNNNNINTNSIFNIIINCLKNKVGIITLILSIVVVIGITMGSTFEKREVASRENANISSSKETMSNQKDTNTDIENQKSDKSVEVPSSNSSGNENNSSSGYKDGEYTGQAKGFNGDIKVSVTISGGKISSIDILETSDDKEYLDMAKAVIDGVIQNQNTNVEAVSGATFSSNGILDAIQKALDSGV